MASSVLTRSMSVEDNVQEPVSPTKRRNISLNNAMNFFLNLDASTVLRGNVKLHLAVDQIVKHAMSHGLDQEQLMTLIKIIVHPNTKISQAVRTKLVKCLIPSSKVPQDAVVRILSWISTRIFSNPGPTNLHSVLLRWILLIFDYIDGYDQIHKLYDIVFCFIQSYLLLPHACHLLFLLTRKHDVKLFKVQHLLQLMNKVGPEPCIIGLLTIYKVYCPHLVPMKLEHTHKIFFKAHDSSWRATILEVINSNQQADTEMCLEKEEIKCRRERAFLQPRAKRQKLILPDPHVASDEIAEEADLNSTNFHLSCERIPFAQIDSFHAYLEVLDRIEYPSQIAAALKDKRLQLLLSCFPDQIVITRLCFWIQHFFAFGFRNTDKDGYEKNEQLLQLLLSFSQNVQGFSVVEGFLESYLPVWDGHSFTPLILSLITCVKPASYTELQYSILEPLHKLFFSSDVYFKSMCITALTKLLYNLTISQQGEISSQNERVPQVESDSTVRNVSEGGSHLGVNDISTGTPNSVQKVIFHLISFLDTVTVVGMMMDDDHYLLQMSALDFLDLVSKLFQKFHIPLVCLPVRVIHRLLLSDCPATVARLCEVINLFREAFTAVRNSNRGALTCDTTMSNQAVFSTTAGPKLKAVEKFNGLLLDVLGMLWQGRLFQERANKLESIFQFKLPSHLEGQLRDNALTMYTGPAFLGLAYTFLKETQREDKKIHPLQIEPFKDRYLMFLERENFPEFRKLVNTNIKSRMEKSVQ